MSNFSSVFDEKSVKFLYDYLNNYSPTSYEAENQKRWLEYIKPYIDEYTVDNYGTVVGIINPEAEYKVVIEAHADEISWYVNYITEEGFIYVKRNGGSDAMIAPSKRVKIWGRKGIVPGVFGWPAIHLRSRGKLDPPSLENIFIDVGAKSKAEVLEMGLHPGAVIAFDDEFTEIRGNFVGRALDNRIGGFMIAQVARLLKENNVKLPFGLYIVNAVMEEVGLRGAQMIADSIKPNVAIITDVGHDTTTPMIKTKEEGEFEIGKGPILAYAPSIHNKLMDIIMETATENGIPFQEEALSRSTGTDTDAFAFSNGGVPSALLSLPLRYMHTTVETASKEDVLNVIKLYYYSLQKIENNHDFRFFS